MRGVYMHSKGILAGPSDVVPTHVPEGVQYMFPADEACVEEGLTVCWADEPRVGPRTQDKINTTTRLIAEGLDLKEDGIGINIPDAIRQSFLSQFIV